MVRRAAAPALVVVPLVMLLASACGSQEGSATQATPAATGAGTGTDQGAIPWNPAGPIRVTTTSTQPSTPAATTTAPVVGPPVPGPCGAPTKALLDWAAMALAPHNGPITASTVVFAASTASGDWYVIGIDRAYVHDNGTLAGGRSRDLGLTNAVKRRTADSKVIPLGGEHKGVMSVSWDSVSWNDDKLSAGEAAADQAIECLDSAAR